MQVGLVFLFLGNKDQTDFNNNNDNNGEDFLNEADKVLENVEPALAVNLNDITNGNKVVK